MLFRSGTSFLSTDLEWVRSHAPADGSVEVREVTDDLACIGLWGPDARDVLGQATGDDLSNDAFPYLTARQLTVAGKPAWAQRVSYIRELGWALYLANTDAGAVWDALLALRSEARCVGQ